MHKLSIARIGWSPLFIPIGLVMLVLLLLLDFSHLASCWDDTIEHADDCYLNFDPAAKYLEAGDNQAETCGIWTDNKLIGGWKTKRSSSKSSRQSSSKKQNYVQIKYPDFCQHHRRKLSDDKQNKNKMRPLKPRRTPKRKSYQGYRDSIGYGDEPHWATTPKPEVPPQRYRVAHNGAAPFFVSIKGRGVICNGVIIDAKVVLTSGTCIERAYDEKIPLKVYVGYYPTHEVTLIASVVSVERICFHETYDRHAARPLRPRDYALLKIEGELKFTGDKLSPICLPRNYKEREYGYADCFALGTGKVRTIKESSVPRDFYAMDVVKTPCIHHRGDNPHPSVSCIQTIDPVDSSGASIPIKRICDGDQGGPVVCRKLMDGGQFEHQYWLVGIIMGPEDPYDCETSAFSNITRVVNIDALRWELAKYKYLIKNNMCDGPKIESFEL